MTSLKRLKSETKILNNIVKPRMSSIIISNYEMRKESSIIFYNKSVVINFILQSFKLLSPDVR